MELEIIKSWEEVDVELFKELKSIDSEEYSTRFSHSLEQLCILSNTNFDDEFWEEMSVDDIEDYFDKIDWVNKEPRSNIKQDIGSFKFIGVDKISFGQYIDLLAYFNNGYFINIDKICAVFYRKYYTDQFGKVIYEPYDFNIEERKLEFHEIPISNVFGIISTFKKLKEKFESHYPIFQNIPDEPEIEIEDLTPAEKQEMKKEAEKEEQKKNWIWEDIAFNLAGKDITKMNDVFNLPVTFVFNMLSYMQVTK